MQAFADVQALVFDVFGTVVDWRGGVPIKVGDETIGAVGASGAPGGKLDDACARAGIDKIKDRLQ